MHVCCRGFFRGQSYCLRKYLAEPFTAMGFNVSYNFANNTSSLSTYVISNIADFDQDTAEKAEIRIFDIFRPE